MQAVRTLDPLFEARSALRIFYYAGNTRNDSGGTHDCHHPNRVRPPGPPLRQDPHALAGGERLRGVCMCV